MDVCVRPALELLLTFPFYSLQCLQELDAFGRDRVPKNADLEHLPYVQASHSHHSPFFSLCAWHTNAAVLPISAPRLLHSTHAVARCCCCCA